MLLSILIPSVPERHEKLKSLLESLLTKTRDFQGEVEVLTLIDFKTMSLGEKRNRLMQIASGLYCIHLDDDDNLTVDALHVLIPLLSEFNEMEFALGNCQRPDVIAYDQHCRLELDDGVAEFDVRTSIEFENETPRQVDGVWQDVKRKPWHWCCWRTELARRFQFVGRVDEDWQWLQQILPAVTKQHKIDQVLHLYQFSSKSTLCAAEPTT
jgi:hypothetical protein